MIRRSFLKMVGLVAGAVMLGITKIKQRWLTIHPGDDLQDAIDVVSESGGGTVYLSNGTYHMNESVHLTGRGHGVTISGSSGPAAPSQP